MNMTNALRIDTLAFANRLKEAGADERLATAIVEGLAVADVSHLATKEDLAGVKAELKDEIAGVKAEIAGVKAEIAEVKAELPRFATKEDLRAEIVDLRTEIKGDIAGVSGKIDRLMYALVAFCIALVVAFVGSASF